MTTTVFLVRHAAHGLLGRELCGRKAGVSLSPDGRGQAEALAERLRREPIEAVVTSPLERARETAEPIGEALGLVPDIAEAFTEIDYGAWTGARLDDLAGDPRFALWNTARGQNRPPAGESLLEVQARAARALESLRDAHPDAGVAVVSHADVIKAVVLYHLGLPVDAHARIEIEPASISTLAVGTWGAKIVALNERVRL